MYMNTETTLTIPGISDSIFSVFMLISPIF